MNDLGEYLKKEREKKGITLEDASKITRIRKVYLQAVEDGDFGMQSPVFIKGFLKSYADFLGLDSTDIIERYDDYLNKKEDKPGVEKGFELGPVSNRRRYLLTAALGMALITAIYILTASEKTDTTPPQVQHTAKAGIPEQKPVLSNSILYRAPLAIITTSQKKFFKPITASTSPPKLAVKTVQPQGKVEKRHTLIITARELTWLRVTVDNNNPVEVLLKEGESTTWFADTKITVVAGNAGGVDLTFNGKPVERLGASGKAITKIFPE